MKKKNKELGSEGTVPEVIGEARRTGVGVSVGVGVGAEGRGFESVILEARAVPVCDFLIL